MSKKSTSYYYDNDGNANANIEVILGYAGAGDVTKRRADITLGENFVDCILEISKATNLQPEYVIRIVLDDLITRFILYFRQGNVDVTE